ncbi:Calx-beta domain-containing protein [Luteitalea sp.]
MGGQSIVGLALTAPTVALSLTSGSLYEGNAAVYVVTLSRPWVDDVEVAYATSNGTAEAGTDYTSTSGTLTIPAGQTIGTITVPTTLRSGAQLSRTFTLTLTSAIDAGGDRLTRTTSAVVTTILDTDAAPTFPTLSVAAVAPADEGDPLIFRVTASFAPTTDITFSHATSNGSAIAGTDYTATSGTATLPASATFVDIEVPTTLRSGFQGARTLTMTISAATLGGAPVTITTSAATGTIAETELLSGANGHFDTMIARADYVTGLSFRPVPGEPKLYTSGIHTGKVNPYFADQLVRKLDGGYADDNVVPVSVTYSPGTDTDTNAQDAGKAVIPAFEAPVDALGADLAIDSMTVNLGTNRQYDNGTAVKIGTEIIIVGSKPRATATVSCQRAQFGTTAQAHTAGTVARRSISSLPNQVRMSINTTAGQSYYIEWDKFYTDSWLRKPGIGETADHWLKNHKACQLTSKSAAGTLWEESATRFTSSGNEPSPAPGFDNTIHVAEADWRSYMDLSSDGEEFNPAAPNNLPASITRRYPTRPMLTTFIIHPNRWTRWHIHIQQRIDDRDLMSVWLSDEETDPVQLFANRPVKAWQPGVVNGSIKQWWLEMDTSDSELFRRDQRDFVCYVRNFVVNNMAIADVPAILERPER